MTVYGTRNALACRNVLHFICLAVVLFAASGTHRGSDTESRDSSQLKSGKRLRVIFDLIFSAGLRSEESEFFEVGGAAERDASLPRVHLTNTKVLHIGHRVDRMILVVVKREASMCLSPG